MRRCLLIFVCLFAPDRAQAAFAHVSTTQGAGSTSSVTASNSVTSGNLLIATCATSNSATATISSSPSQTWSVLNARQTKTTFSFASWYTIATSTAGYTATCSNGLTATLGFLMQFSGEQNPAVTDGTNTSNGTGTSVTGGNVTTTFANDLILGLDTTDSASATCTQTAGTDNAVAYTIPTNGKHSLICGGVEYKIVTATATYSGPITIDSANLIGFTSSFKDSTFAPASASRLSLIGVGP